MKILISAGKSLDTKSFNLGWFNALSSLGYNCKWWDTEDTKKSSFDVFSDERPDLVLVHGDEITRAGAKLLKDDDIKKIIFNDTDEPNEHLQSLNLPYVMFSRRFPEFIESHGTLSCLPAADITRYKPGKESSLHACDVSFIGKYDESKKEIYNKFLYPLFNEAKVRIYGYGYWPVANHIGSITDNETFCNVVLNSALNLSMSDAIGAIPSERIYKVLACGGILVVHNVNKSYEKEFSCSGCGSFIELDDIRGYLSTSYNKDIRNCLAETGLEFIETSNTYYHRAYDVFKILGINTDRIENSNEKIGYSLT